jgi:ElaB/YqjD/DUF883 family membrane-anchored ribosome-binding protein
VLTVFAAMGAAVASFTKSVANSLMILTGTGNVIDALLVLMEKVSNGITRLGAMIQALSRFIVSIPVIISGGALAGPSVAAAVGTVIEHEYVATMTAAKADMEKIRAQILKTLSEPVPTGKIIPSSLSEADLKKIQDATEYVEGLEFAAKKAQLGTDKLHINALQLARDLKDVFKHTEGMSFDLETRGIHAVLQKYNAEKKEIFIASEKELEAERHKFAELTAEGEKKRYQQGLADAVKAGADKMEAAKTAILDQIALAAALSDNVKVLQIRYDELTQEYNRNSDAGKSNKDTLEQMFEVLGQMDVGAQDIEKVIANLQKLASGDIDLTNLAGSIDEVLAQLAVLGESQTPEMNKRITEMVKQLSGQFKSIKKDIGDVTDSIIQFERAYASSMNKARGSMIRFLDGQATFTQTMSASLETLAMMVAEGMGQAVTDLFQAFKAGESVLGSLKNFLGEVLIKFGEMAISLGMIALAGQLIPAFKKIFGATPGEALMLIGVGAAAVAAGVALGGGGSGKSANSTASPSSGSGSDTRTIYLEPYFQRQNDLINRLNAAVEGMSRTIDSFSTRPAGVIVKEGLTGAGRQVAQILTNTVSGSSTTRMNLANAVLGRT